LVAQERGLGWQSKSTKDSTPVTWKRAKIPDKERLVRDSLSSTEAQQELGDRIIDFCNEHAQASLDKYELDAIGLCRLIRKESGFIYYERQLCTRENPRIFESADYYWKWSNPKKEGAKEQLPALHGIRRDSDEKWFAWHGRSENQLHFTGERNWWPAQGDPCRRDFPLPRTEDILSLSDLTRMLRVER
jgi:hypothetical protein